MDQDNRALVGAEQQTLPTIGSTDAEKDRKRRFASILTPCLQLVVGGGMQADERRAWLASAYVALSNVPFDLLERGAKAAMIRADHQSKIIPLIMSEVGDALKWRAPDQSRAISGNERLRLQREQEANLRAIRYKELSEAQVRNLNARTVQLAVMQGTMLVMMDGRRVYRSRETIAEYEAEQAEVKRKAGWD